MSKSVDGGTAFPATEADHGLNFGSSGMTLRQYFAAKALQGILSTEQGLKLTHAERAEFAHNQADAMIAAGAA